jgi:XTP/dITP diphosphohydrolase
MKLIFASNNKHKIQEIRNLLPSHFSILSLEDINCFEDIPETADTIEGNAILKANYVSERYNTPCFADDSGLEVESLNGAPGVYSARYAGSQRSDAANIKKLLTELTPFDNRNAQFKTVIALNYNGQQHLFTGIIKGKITFEEKGTNGFGYDPVFIPEGFVKTFAEMSSEQKNQISHRAIAVNKLIQWLLKCNNQ